MIERANPKPIFIGSLGYLNILKPNSSACEAGQSSLPSSPDEMPEGPPRRLGAWKDSKPTLVAELFLSMMETKLR